MKLADERGMQRTTATATTTTTKTEKSKGEQKL